MQKNIIKFDKKLINFNIIILISILFIVIIIFHIFYSNSNIIFNKNNCLIL
jgi:hypothetical protein